MKRCIIILLTILLLAACGTGGQAPAQQPESGPSPASEPAPEPDPGSLPEPSSPSPVEAEPEPAEPPDEGGEWDPDSGTGIPDPGPDSDIESQVYALVAYLEENLDPFDYADIQPFIGGDGSWIDVTTPFPDKVKSVVDAYTGPAIPVECPYVPFSSGQMQQAREDAERFLEQHPEIGLLMIRAQLGLFSGWIINVEEESSALTEFVKNYSIADIYQVVVGETAFPD